MLEKGDKNIQSLSVKKRTPKAFLEVKIKWLFHAIRQPRDSRKYKGWEVSPKQKNTAELKIE